MPQSLLAKLTSTKRKLEAGGGPATKNIVNAFLNEVQAVSCPKFACPESKHLTSEAHALLSSIASSSGSGCRSHLRMMAARLIAVWTSILFVVGLGRSVSSNEDLPSRLAGIKIPVSVTRDSGGIFTYKYWVVNPISNVARISSVAVEITRGPDDSVLWQPEPYGSSNLYLGHSSREASRRVAMVPVGIFGPHTWTSGLSVDTLVRPRGFASWRSITASFHIPPGMTRSDFRLTSYGLPWIRDVKFEPGIDYNAVPDEPQKVREVRDHLTFWAKTVGPKAPPKNFIPVEFLNSLIGLLHDTRQLGWIRVDSVHQSLLAQLTASKRKLEAGEAVGAKSILALFLQQVQDVGCPEIRCAGNRPLTHEAYALLFFNGQYLRARLS